MLGIKGAGKNKPEKSMFVIVRLLGYRLEMASKSLASLYLWTSWIATVLHAPCSKRTSYPCVSCLPFLSFLVNQHYWVRFLNAETRQDLKGWLVSEQLLHLCQGLCYISWSLPLLRWSQHIGPMCDLLPLCKGWWEEFILFAHAVNIE